MKPWESEFEAARSERLRLCKWSQRCDCGCATCGQSHRWKQDWEEDEGNRSRWDLQKLFWDERTFKTRRTFCLCPYDVFVERSWCQRDDNRGTSVTSGVEWNSSVNGLDHNDVNKINAAAKPQLLTSRFLRDAFNATYHERSLFQASFFPAAAGNSRTEKGIHSIDQGRSLLDINPYFGCTSVTKLCLIYFPSSDQASSFCKFSLMSVKFHFQESFHPMT